jgi:hypothetical protein
VSLQEIRKVLRHGLEIVRAENSILLSRLAQDSGIGDSYQLRLAHREEVHRRLTPPTTANDCMVETGIRQEAHHPSALPRWKMPTRAPQLFFQFGRRRMRFCELLFEVFTLRQVLFHVTLIAEVEGDRAINLLEAQRRIMRSDGFWGLAAPKLLHDKCQWHPTSVHVEASVSAFNEFLGHNALALSLNHSCSINDEAERHAGMIPNSQPCGNAGIAKR